MVKDIAELLMAMEEGVDYAAEAQMLAKLCNDETLTENANLVYHALGRDKAKEFLQDLLVDFLYAHITLEFSNQMGGEDALDEPQ